jgi:hypothetical protein
MPEETPHEVPVFIDRIEIPNLRKPYAGGPKKTIEKHTPVRRLPRVIGYPLSVASYDSDDSDEESSLIALQAKRERLRAQLRAHVANSGRPLESWTTLRSSPPIPRENFPFAFDIKPVPPTEDEEDEDDADEQQVTISGSLLRGDSELKRKLLLHLHQMSQEKGFNNSDEGNPFLRAIKRGFIVREDDDDDDDDDEEINSDSADSANEADNFGFQAPKREFFEGEQYDEEDDEVWSDHSLGDVNV